MLPFERRCSALSAARTNGQGRPCRKVSHVIPCSNPSTVTEKKIQAPFRGPNALRDLALASPSLCTGPGSHLLGLQAPARLRTSAGHLLSPRLPLGMNPPRSRFPDRPILKHPQAPSQSPSHFPVLFPLWFPRDLEPPSLEHKLPEGPPALQPKVEIITPTSAREGAILCLFKNSRGCPNT